MIMMANDIQGWILQAFSHFTYVTAHSPILPSLYLRHSSFSNPSFVSPTSQLILQPFRFSYVTGFSLTLPGEPPMGMDGGLSFPWHLSYSWEKPRKILQPCKLTRTEMEPWPASWEATMLPLDRSWEKLLITSNMLTYACPDSHNIML